MAANTELGVYDTKLIFRQERHLGCALATTFVGKNRWSEEMRTFVTNVGFKFLGQLEIENY